MGGINGHEKKVSERETLTNWRVHREAKVRTRKESERARATHFLESASGRTSKDTQKKANERGTLTSWRSHREGQVRSWKKREQSEATHLLQSASGGTSEETERQRASEGHVRT